MHHFIRCLALGFLLFLTLSLRADAPSERVSQHLGNATVAIIQALESATAMRVGDLDYQKAGAPGTAGARLITGPEATLSAANLQLLQAALLADDTYFQQDSKGTSAGVAFVGKTPTGAVIEVSCCLQKGNVFMVVKDATGKIIKQGDVRGFRNAPAAPLRILAAAVFQGDAQVQKSKPLTGAAPPVVSVPRPGDMVMATTVEGVEITLFIPAEAKVLRGLYLHVANTQFKTDDQWAQSCRVLQFGHVVLSMNMKSNNRGTKMRETLLAGLRDFAAQSGRKELLNVPFIGTGHSAGGLVAQALEPLPQRTIGVAIDCAWIANPAKLQGENLTAVPRLFSLGELPDDFKMLPDIENNYVPGRKSNLPWTLALKWGCAHDWGSAGALIVPWSEALVRLRLPQEADARQGPVKLRSIPENELWLGERSATGHWATIAAAADYRGDKTSAVWLPGRAAAMVWRAIESRQPPLVLEASDGQTQLGEVSPPKSRNLFTQRGANVTLGATITPPLAVKTVRYYNGERELGMSNAAPWRVQWNSVPVGAHAIFAVWETADGQFGSSNPSLIVVRP